MASHFVVEVVVVVVCHRKHKDYAIQSHFHGIEGIDTATPPWGDDSNYRSCQTIVFGAYHKLIEFSRLLFGWEFSFDCRLLFGQVVALVVSPRGC